MLMLFLSLRLHYELIWSWIKVCACVLWMTQTVTAVWSPCVSWKPSSCLPALAAHPRHRCWSRPPFMPSCSLLMLDLVNQKKKRLSLCLMWCEQIFNMWIISSLQLTKQSFQTKCTNRWVFVPVTWHSKFVTNDAAVIRYLACLYYIII